MLGLWWGLFVVYYKDKKGLEKKTIVELILLLVVFGILAGMFLPSYLKSSTSGSDLATCKTSVYTASKAEKLPFLEGEGYIYCPIQELEFKKVRLDEFGEVNEEIADSLNSCISASWDGKLDWTSSEFFDTVKRACVVCSVITFDEKSRGVYDGKTFNRWIEEHYIFGSNVTYFTYYDEFNKKVLPQLKVEQNTVGWKSVPGLLVNFPSDSNPIDSNKIYVTYFGRLTGGFFDKDAVDTEVSLKPIEEMVKDCGRVANIKGFKQNIEEDDTDKIKEALSV